jgi:8-oxo-dGTP pyrophosphatase MutT (NUDIX family)
MADLTAMEIRDLLIEGRGDSLTEFPQKEYLSAAVLVPLLNYDDNWHLLFTRRTETVNNHKGQVSFPGGGVESHDESPIAAALRETFEEIGIESKRITILGQLKDIPTSRGYLISPIVGVITDPVTLKISSQEVARVFTIPLEWLSERTNWEKKEYVHSNGEKTNEVFYRPYGGEILWGVTARITLRFLQTLDRKSK